MGVDLVSSPPPQDTLMVTGQLGLATAWGVGRWDVMGTQRGVNQRGSTGAVGRLVVAVESICGTTLLWSTREQSTELWFRGG